MVPGFGVLAECKAQELVARSRGLVIQPQKFSVGAYFELSFLGMWFVQKIRFSLHESGWTKAWCLGLVTRLSAKAQEPVARSRGLVILNPKLSVGAYFDLLILGCGFLIHLSNRSDSPRFRAPWKKIRQKYRTQQEPSLFKGHLLSCQYGDALCSMVPMLWQSAETPNPGTMPWSTQTQEGKI